MNKSKNIPELRFPEFKNSGEWKEKRLGSKFVFQDGYAFQSKHFISKTEKTTQVIRITDINSRNKNTDKVFISDDLIEQLNLEKYVVQKGDLLLSLTGAAGFNFFIWDSGKAILNQRTMKIYPKSDKDKALTVLLDPIVHSTINRFGTGQNNNLSKDLLTQLVIFLPDLNEQQKIADCLSSLDDLLKAETEKLEALRTHKKGLMQQLFPAEGARTPAFRFPEFRGSGDWKEKRLGEMVYNISSGKDKAEPNGVFDLYGSTGVIGKTKSNSYNGKFLLVARVGANAGALNAINSEFGATDNCLVITLIESQSTDFIFHLLSNFNLPKLAFGSGQPLITGAQLKKLNLLMPNVDEQKKIAECLTATDTIIKEQFGKLQQLRLHKKGLMQGLFPQPTEA